MKRLLKRLNFIIFSLKQYGYLLQSSNLAFIVQKLILRLCYWLILFVIRFITLLHNEAISSYITNNNDCPGPTKWRLLPLETHHVSIDLLLYLKYLKKETFDMRLQTVQFSIILEMDGKKSFK